MLPGGLGSSGTGSTVGSASAAGSACGSGAASSGGVATGSACASSSGTAKRDQIFHSFTLPLFATMNRRMKTVSCVYNEKLNLRNLT